MLPRFHHYRNILFVPLLLWGFLAHGQEIPSLGENLAYLVTFSKGAKVEWGDDDFSQTFFFVIPENIKDPVYIRVFDPDIGGEVDQANQGFNSRTSFEVYGGKGAFSNPEARKLDPVGNYKSGNLLASKTFDNKSEYDNKWYTFGPFDPQQGEYSESVNGRVFKIVADGISGDDGNLYKYFLSRSADQNIPIEGGNGFTYEYSFRLVSEGTSIAHIYPFIDEKVVSLHQHNFDFDNNGNIKLYSRVKNGHNLAGSGNDEWKESGHKIADEERGKSMNIRIIKSDESDNDMVFYVTNQYNEPIPFFAVPIGGKPKYQYKIDIKYY